MKRHFTFKPEKIVKEPNKWTVKFDPFFVGVLFVLYLFIIGILIYFYFKR